MALRKIRLIGDEMLTKPCREVKEITPRIQELIEDMLETMYQAEGIGLAAPQVGVLRQVVVIDIGIEEPEPLILINPVITRTEGEQTGNEGCLSLPGKVGQVTRPQTIEATYFDENMDEYELEAEGLLARAICHEVDHLNGHVYTELVEGEIHDVMEPDEEEDEQDEEAEGEETEMPEGETEAEAEPSEEETPDGDKGKGQE